MYIDAGTGSMMLQVIVAGFFTVILFFKNIQACIKRHLSKRHLSNDSLEKNNADRG